MKWTFKYLFTSVPSLNKGLFGQVNYTDICTGGSYIADDEKTLLELTDREVFLRNKDYVTLNDEWLAGFFGGRKPSDSGYIGKWTEDIDKNAKIYYCILDNIIHKVFVVKDELLGLSNLLGILYVIEFNGNMMDCVPEDGDILYDSKKEAEKTIKKNKK